VRRRAHQRADRDPASAPDRLSCRLGAVGERETFNDDDERQHARADCGVENGRDQAELRRRGERGADEQARAGAREDGTGARPGQGDPSTPGGGSAARGDALALENVEAGQAPQRGAHAPGDPQIHALLVPGHHI
jgi:hypothetical protein